MSLLWLNQGAILFGRRLQAVKLCEKGGTFVIAGADMAPLRTKNRDNLEFATNLPDKEERKRVRRLRVERAIAAQDTDGLDTSKNDEETTACSLSQQQVGAAGRRVKIFQNRDSVCVPSGHYWRFWAMQGTCEVHHAMSSLLKCSTTPKCCCVFSIVSWVFFCFTSTTL